MLIVYRLLFSLFFLAMQLTIAWAGEPRTIRIHSYTNDLTAEIHGKSYPPTELLRKLEIEIQQNPRINSIVVYDDCLTSDEAKEQLKLSLRAIAKRFQLAWQYVPALNHPDVIREVVPQRPPNITLRQPTCTYNQSHVATVPRCQKKRWLFNPMRNKCQGTFRCLRQRR